VNNLADFLLDNIGLVAVAALSAAGVIWTFTRGGGAAAKIDAVEAVRLINDSAALVLDVRGREEFAKGRLAQAKNIPADEIAARADADLGKHKEKPLIAVCETGARALGVAADLRRRGFVKVVVLSGGLRAWREAGLPLAKK
jgi:rhodanese-related sulfurtransferase